MAEMHFQPLHHRQESTAREKTRLNNEQSRATHLVEFDDVGVVEQLHNLHFSVNLLQVRRVQSGLVDDFDGHLGTKIKISHFIYFFKVKIGASYWEMM